MTEQPPTPPGDGEEEPEPSECPFRLKILCMLLNFFFAILRMFGWNF